MPRPQLPRADQLAAIAKALRDEGFSSVRIDTAPDGSVSITAGMDGGKAKMSPLEEWKAGRAAS